MFLALVTGSVVSTQKVDTMRGYKLLVIEPKGHVSAEDFGRSVAVAEEEGLRHIESPHIRGDREALFER